MRTFLDKMHDLKLKEVAKRQSIITEKNLRKKIEELSQFPVFKKHLYRGNGENISLVLELKSKTPARKNVERFDPEKIVKDYVVGGAKAISVITDEHFFGGSLKTLEDVRKFTTLPLLHKEFIINSYQLLEGRARGSSAALILAYYFKEQELREIISMFL